MKYKVVKLEPPPQSPEQLENYLSMMEFHGFRLITGYGEYLIFSVICDVDYAFHTIGADTHENDPAIVKMHT